MTHATDGAHSRLSTYNDTARAIASQVSEYLEVFSGLDVLRTLGDDESDVADSVIALPQFKKIRLSWELLDALTSGDGLDADGILLRHMDEDTMLLCKRAIWGVGYEEIPDPRPFTLIRGDAEG